VVSSGVSVAEQRLSLAVAAAELGSWTWDMASGTTTWDPRLEEMHGLAPGGFGGTFEDWVAALHPGDRDECIARVNAALADPGPYVLIHRTTWSDGSVHTVECRGMVLVDADGQPTGTTGVALDVTGREQLVQTLQQSLLPTMLPRAPGLTVATRYRAAESTTAIGGDWYAAIALPGGRLGIGIGDVAGHGLGAVADMAAARFSLRALALNEARPDVVMEQLNEVVRVFEGDAMITALYGVLDASECTWSYASAGHVPAALRDPDGTTRFLDAPPDPPLGTARAFRARQVSVVTGSTLLLYTDGLIERRRESMTEGFSRLRRAVAQGPADPESLCDYVLDQLLEDRANADDVAIVAVTFDGP
jgi:PAS domain S-box-containing protein